ncbi:MAG: insulinase family protein [Alphaproteobacteria bacterium]|nr:MAG: insulinase family protein [Alphaproteobacteria bacterium]
MATYQQFADGEEMTILDNGMHVMTKTDRTDPVVAMKVQVVNTGMYYEDHRGARETEMSHILEHVVAKGSIRHGVFAPYSDLIDELSYTAIGSNATTNNHSTNYALDKNTNPIQVLKEYEGQEDWRIILEANLDMCFYPNFENNIVEAEYLAVKNETSGYAYREEQDKNALKYRELTRAFYPEIRNYRLSDTERLNALLSRPVTAERLEEFWLQHYHPSAIRVSVCGDITHQEVVDVCSHAAYNRRNEPLAQRGFGRLLQQDADIRIPDPMAEICSFSLVFGDNEASGSLENSPRGDQIKMLYEKIFSHELLLELRHNRRLVYGCSVNHAILFSDNQNFMAIETSCLPQDVLGMTKGILSVSERLLEKPTIVEEILEKIIRTEKKQDCMDARLFPKGYAKRNIDALEVYGTIMPPSCTREIRYSITPPEIMSYHAQRLCASAMGILTYGNTEHAPPFEQVKDALSSLGRSYSPSSSCTRPGGIRQRGEDFRTGPSPAK